jgi:hypothetical protein
MENIRIPIDTNTLAGYNVFLDCKKLPRYTIEGNTVVTDPESYRIIFGGTQENELKTDDRFLFDYQRHIVNVALERKRYAAFLDCGLGKTLIQLEWCRQVSSLGKVLLLCPLSVIDEFYNDIKKFNLGINVTNLRKETNWADGIAILNYESMREDIDMKGVQGICLDESSILKNGDGKTRNWLVMLSRNIPYRLACSATPAPNEQSEYASHAVFLGISSTIKEFYSRFFRKQGNDWILKEHAIKPFYHFVRSWACYIQNPEILGFERGGHLPEEPEYHIVKCKGNPGIDNGMLFSSSASLTDARKIFQYRSKKDTDRFMKAVDFAKKYRSIIWCNRNDEEQAFADELPHSVLITGKTKPESRKELLDAFRAGEINNLISKPSILGWGVNIQQAEAHIYSGYDFSFEMFYQAVRRSHRFGREGRLKVFLPAIQAEMPIIDSLTKKMKSFEQDVFNLQNLFNE